MNVSIELREGEAVIINGKAFAVARARGKTVVMTTSGASVDVGDVTEGVGDVLQRANRIREMLDKGKREGKTSD